MKGVVVALLGFTLGIYLTAHAQLNPSCVRCFGTPECPGCCSGYLSGAVVCWISGDHCYTDGTCDYNYGGGCFVVGT
ncbi:MAG: hypothetical protein P8181_15910, partial [bacterium]